MKPETELLIRIIETPYEELYNDHLVQCQINDWEEELWLEQAIKDWKKFATKYLFKPQRKKYMEIIRLLEKELEDVRVKANPYRRRTMGYQLGRNPKKDRNTRDTDNKFADSFSSTLRATSKRVYGLGRQTK